MGFCTSVKTCFDAGTIFLFLHHRMESSNFRQNECLQSFADLAEAAFPKCCQLSMIETEKCCKHFGGSMELPTG